MKDAAVFSSMCNSNLVVISLVALAQGVLGLADLSMSYLYKDDFGMSPAEVSMAVSLTNIPWIVKPLWGFTSDCFPIFGRRRAPYLIIFGSLAVISWIFMSVAVSTPFTAIATMMVIQICNAFCNVIGEAIVVEQGQCTRNESTYVSLFFGIRAIGTIVTAYVGGLLIEVIHKRNVFLVTACFPLLLCGAAAVLREEAAPSSTRVREQVQEIWRFVKQPRIVYPVLFVLFFMSTPSCVDALFYYFTNELGFRPEFMGEMRMVWGIGTLLGIYCYNTFLYKYSFKTMILYSSLVAAVVGNSQIFLVTGYSRSAGVPDSLFAMTTVFFNQAIGEINIMPILVLSCKLCPKNIEASLYALMMSTLNLGQLIASQLGGLLMLALGITQTEFDHLWILILLTNVIMLLPLPFLLLVPNETPTEKEEEETEPLAAGLHIEDSHDLMGLKPKLV